jgi:hypothetical protein
MIYQSLTQAELQGVSGGRKTNPPVPILPGRRDRWPLPYLPEPSPKPRIPAQDIHPFHRL